MRYITLGECNKNMIYILIGGIIKPAIEIITFFFSENAKVGKHPFLLGINSGFGMSLALIPYIYSYKYSKISEKANVTNQEKTNELTRNTTTINNNKYIDQLFNKNDQIIKKNKYLTLFLCAFLDFTQRLISFLLRFKIAFNFWIFDIVFLNVFTSLIIKNQLYKHHYFSIIIMILFGILFNVVFLSEIKLEDIPMLILNLLLEIMYSLAIVLAKYGMDDLFCSPFEVTFYEGIFALILNIIFLLISTHIPISFENVSIFSKLFKISEYNGKYYLDNFYSYIDEFDSVEILYFLIVMIERASFNLLSHITIKYFTSSHVVIIFILSETFLNVPSLDTTGIIITIVVFIVEIFMVLVFCEIIELNFCGFEINTRKNIKERAKLAIFDEDENSNNYLKENGTEVEMTTDRNRSFNSSFN